MKLSEERKQQILASLKEDYVVFSDIFYEMCADIVADIVMTGSLNTEEGRREKTELRELKRSYTIAIPDNYQKVIPYIERVLELKKKYNDLREKQYRDGIEIII